MSAPDGLALAVCTDEGYLLQTEVLAASIAWHRTSKMPVVLHVFYVGPKSRASERLARFRRANVSVQLHHLASNPWDGTRSRGKQPATTYLRLSLPELLPSVDRVAYLDPDVILLHDIAPLLGFPLREQPVAAAADMSMETMRVDGEPITADGFDGSTDSYLRDIVGLGPSQRYVNAGVILMDLKRLRAEDFTGRARTLLSQRGGSFRFDDQCALNHLLAGRIAELPLSWNIPARHLVSRWPHAEPAEERRRLRAALKKPRLLHFVGPKPWRAVAAGGHLWWRYADLSEAGPELREQYGKIARPPLIPPPPLWSRWAGPLTAARGALRRERP